MADLNGTGRTVPSHHKSKKRPPESSEVPNTPDIAHRPRQTPASPISRFQIQAGPTQMGAQAQPPPKVAIPRLRRESDGKSAAASSKLADKHRVNHACEPCRHRKTKCSGERPTCKHCEDFKIRCVYADGKRDRVKREFGDMAERLNVLAKRVDEYEKLLQDVMLRSGPLDQARIKKILDQENALEDDEQWSAGGSRPTPVDKENSSGSEVEGETNVSARRGSTGSLDRTHEDLNRDPASRATGFVGKNSEVTWIQRLRGQQNETNADSSNADDASMRSTTKPSYTKSYASVNQAHPSQPYELQPDNGVNDSSYHCDDLEIGVPDNVSPWDLPPRHIANLLLQTYLECVHPTFPIIGKRTFTSQAQTFLDSNGKTKPGDNWAAILNLIFAIAAKYAQLARAEWRGDGDDHLIYFTRARLLGMNSESIFVHPSLQTVQVTGLMSFYFLTVDQINRSWTFSGMALRCAVSLGLNLQIDNQRLADSSKEIRYRVWWALYGLERMLNTMSGRASSISDRDCTTPLPLPIDEEHLFSAGLSSHDSQYPLPSLESSRATSNTSSHSAQIQQSSPSATVAGAIEYTGNGPQATLPSISIYFRLHTELSKLMYEVLTSLYRAEVSSTSWANVQSDISRLDKMVETWRSGLPSFLDFTKCTWNEPFIRQRLSLGFFYYSIRIVVNRPCLCRLDRRIPDESLKSKNMSQHAAKICVWAAKEMVELLPPSLDPPRLYATGPWWSLVHHLVQATTVLMIELNLRAEHMPGNAEEVLHSAKKAVIWLHEMGKDDVSARRAWAICNDLLDKAALKVGRVNDLSPDPPIPREQETSNANGVVDGSNPTEWTESHDFLNNLPNSTYYGHQRSQNDPNFNPAMYTSYDEFMPYTSTTTSHPTLGSLFRHPLGMESMNMDLEDLESPDIFFSQHEQWDPRASRQ